MISEYIDHTNLKATATSRDIEKLCQETIDYQFRAICINTVHIPIAMTVLRNFPRLPIVTVVDFPLGASHIDVKLKEIEVAYGLGATEVDVVWNLGAFKNKEYLKVLLELSRIVRLSHGMVVKIIVEAHHLNPKERYRAFSIVEESGAQYIKSSTGTVGESQYEAVCQWCKRKSDLKIKAAGGIKTYLAALDYVGWGVDVIGTSSGLRIIEEEKNANPKLSE